jgi:hypothetical protein
MTFSCIRIATRADADAVYRLRLEAYAASREFRLTRPELLLWDEHDDDGIVLVACDASGTMLSTTRGGVVSNVAEAEDALTCSVPLPSSAFPALVLGKGATRRGAGSGGLHSALRYHFLDGVRDSNLGSVLGLVYEGAPRTNLMRRLGYRFERPARFWDPEADALKQPLLAVLDRDRVDAACAELLAELGDLLERFPWAGERILIMKPVQR